jgi:cytochrome P450
VLPISSGFTELTLRIVGESLLGARLGNRIAVIERAVGYWSRHLSNPLVMLRPRVPLWPSPFYRRLAAATAEVEVLLRDLVEEALQKPDSTSFLSALIAQSEKGAVDRKMIRDELLTMLIAGHETTATSMSWMAWLLAVHPEWQKRAREEVQAKGRDPETLADLKSLPVLMAIYLETLRLYPPIWALLRQAVEPVQLGEVSLQPGDHLVVGLAILMRDPRSFASPDEFRPERWLQGGEGKTLAHPAFLAFSAGPRSCIGRDFAVNEVLTVFAVILSRYALHLVDPEPKEMELSFSLRPRGGVQLRVEACSR